MQIRVLLIALVLTVVVIAGFWWWRSSDPEPAPRETTAVETAPVPEPEPTTPAPRADEPVVPTEPAEAPLPPLEESDTVVRDELIERSPALATWLEREDLIRRFAVVVDNAATGEYPRRQLAFLAPPDRMPVVKEEDKITIDPEGYARFDGFVGSLTSVPPADAAALLRRFSPLIAEALGEIGEGEQDALGTVRAAIDQALGTPVVEGEVELVQPKVFYEYADPELEALPAVQKQLLRMGPENVRRLQAYLAEVKAALS